jgi:hypothetical protein
MHGNSFSEGKKVINKLRYLQFKCACAKLKADGGLKIEQRNEIIPGEKENE